MDQRKRTIRKLLTGHITDNGRVIVPAETVWKITYRGTFVGALSARIFGVFSRKRRYRIKMKTALVKETCAAAFLKMGRCVYLSDDPEGLTVLCFPILHNPCVLTSHVEGNVVTAEFFASRTPRAFLNARRAFRQWEKLMPEDSTERVTEEKN